MSKTTLGLIVMAAGVVLCNFTYLFDLVVQDAPCIWLGPKSAIAIVISVLAILFGGLMIVRDRGPAGSTS